MNMRCPKCGNTEMLQVVVKVWADVIHTKEGLETDINDSDHEWDEQSPMRCQACDHVAVAKKFRGGDDRA